ncbi:phage tail spike protein [Clostridium sulfidigenes]|uniref:phage tail spike protein n=1 Tax=Clostridium sulfidigenes TaxID=318464 RepID=UPI003F8BF7E1
MLQLYDLNKVKISNLTLYKDLKIQSVLSNGDKTLSFSYPSRFSDEIKEEGYIRTKTHEFVIKEISTNGEWKSIQAVLNVEDLEGKTWEHFDTSDQTIAECLTLALAGTGWIIGYCNETKKRTIRKINCSTWDIIQDIKKTYFVEMEFDTLNKRINIAKKLGNDKGVYFIDSLNLRDLDVKSNSYDFCTRLIAIGENDLKVTVENYQYSSKKKTIIWKAEKYTDENSLREDAIAKLEELSKPYKSYGADIVDLASINDKYSILSYGLGDIITLISKEEGIKEKQRIVKMVEYPDEPDKNTCEIANTILTFEDMQKEYEDTSKTVNNITSSNGTISEGAIKGTVEKITIKKADIESLNAVEIRVGDLEATSATITQLDAANANIVKLQADKADITELNAGVGRIEILESSVGDIQTLVNGNLTSNNIQSLILTSDKVTVDNGFIKNAMIENLDVSKINSGDISTNKFKIKSDNGGIEITGATQQFKDKNNRVRIQMGQDIKGDFNFILRGEDGTTTLIDHRGIKENAIGDDLIKGNMISENSVGGKQIDYNSFIEEFNKDTNTHTLKSSKVMIDEKGQTLNVAFNELNNTVDGVKTITESNTTAINVQQGKISALISNTTIVKDGVTTQLKDAYNSTVATVDSISSTISSHTTTINELTGQITGVDTRTNEIKRTLDGTVATVSSHSASINGLNSTVSTQSSTIAQMKDSIALKVEAIQVTNIVNGAIDRIEVGGRNLFILKNVGKYKASHNNIGDTANIVIENYTFNIIANPSDLLGCTIYNIKDKLIISGETNLTTLTPHYTFYNENGTVAQVQRSLTITVEDDKFKFILDVPPNAFKMEIGLGLYPYASPYWLKNVKIEKGNKATNWTPAPEDTQEQITTVSKRTATIETNLTGITNRVSSVEQTTTTIDGKVKDMDTRLKTAEVKITDSAIISAVSSTINTAKNDAIELAKAISEGKMIYADATFTKGNNGLNVYNNSGGAHTTVTRIAKPSDCPTTSTHCIEVKTIGGTTSPGLGGFYFGNTARPNAIFILKMIAKIPVGSKLMFASNAYGSGGSAKWLTSNAGTGQWEEYIHKVTCGSDGTFSTTNFFYIDKGTIPFMWRIASATIYDITDTADLTMRINSAEQKITDTAIVSTVRSSTSYKSDLGAKVSSNAIISCINQTAESIKISASKINLTGYVTMTNLSTAGQTIIDGGNIKANTISLERLKSATNNPIIRLFGKCSLDATAKDELGVGTAIRLKWNENTYIRIAEDATDIYQNGIARFRFYPNYLDCKAPSIYFADQCKIDASAGTFRFYISKSVDTGIRISPDGTISFMVAGTPRHVFNTNGTKAGGTIVVDGATLGMSPIDSPKVLLEDVLFDIDIKEEGTTVSLDSTFLKTISTYAVFCSNPGVIIVSKDRTSFTVRGYNGKVDFRVIGYRIGYEEQYYQVVG